MESTQAAGATDQICIPDHDSCRLAADAATLPHRAQVPPSWLGGPALPRSRPQGGGRARRPQARPSAGAPPGCGAPGPGALGSPHRRPDDGTCPSSPVEMQPTAGTGAGDRGGDGRAAPSSQVGARRCWAATASGLYPLPATLLLRVLVTWLRSRPGSPLPGLPRREGGRGPSGQGTGTKEAAGPLPGWATGATVSRVASCQGF